MNPYDLNNLKQKQILAYNQAMLKDIEQRLAIIKQTNLELRRKLLKFNCTNICYNYKLNYPMKN